MSLVEKSYTRVLSILLENGYRVDYDDIGTVLGEKKPHTAIIPLDKVNYLTGRVSFEEILSEKPKGLIVHDLFGGHAAKLSLKSEESV